MEKIYTLNLCKSGEEDKNRFSRKQIVKEMKKIAAPAGEQIKVMGLQGVFLCDFEKIGRVVLE